MAERSVRLSSTCCMPASLSSIHSRGGAWKTFSDPRRSPCSSSRSASSRRSVSTRALPSAWLPRPSPMKSTKFARRRSSASSSASLVRTVSGVRVELRHLGFDALDQVADVLGPIELLPDCLQDDRLGELPADEHLVLAGALRRAEAAVVPAGLPAHLGDRRATLPADHRAREQVRGEVPLPATLTARESTPALATRPASPHLLAPDLGLLPQRRGHDAQRLVLLHHPLGLGLRESAPSPRPRVAPALRLVPHPARDVLLVVQDPAHGRGRPALRGPHPSRDLLLVEHPTDPRQRQPVRVGLEDPQDHRRLTGRSPSCSLPGAAGPSCPSGSYPPAPT
jgi:hypothetical protein